MDVRPYDRFDEFAQRASDWSALVDASPSASVFQTWAWLSAWAKHHRPRGFRGLFVTDGDRVIGGAALEISGRTVRHLGTGASDFLDLLALPGDEARVASSVGAWLSRSRGWDWADFQQAPPDSVTARIPGAQVVVGETCPYLPLPADWESFRRGLGKSLRGNIGYYERALAKRHALELRVADASTFDADMDAFFALHQLRWRSRWMPGAFADSRSRAFHRDAARALLAEGRLRLHTLLLDGAPKASIYCFQKGAACYYYLGGFDPALSRYSPGTVLTARAIRDSLERDGAREFHFLRGNESYKYRWGALDRYNLKVMLAGPGPLGQLRLAGGRLQLAAELRLKNWMHARHGGAGRPPDGKE